MESEVAAAEKAAAQARTEAEEAAALLQDEVRREVSKAVMVPRALMKGLHLELETIYVALTGESANRWTQGRENYVKPHSLLHSSWMS